MAPQTKFQELSMKNGQRISHPAPEEEVVIAGMSGCFPTCDSVYELRDALLNKRDMISDRTTKDQNLIDLPAREGRLNSYFSFDGAFFNLPLEEVEYMDPASRKILEKVYEAIVDAGVNPLDLKGRKVGVYVSYCLSQAEVVWMHATQGANKYTLKGCEKAGLSNKVSRWLGVSGPSLFVDTACSSSAFATNLAYEDLRDGICDCAIVAGCNLMASDMFTMAFMRLGVLSKEGVCRAFDEQASGYVRSEAMCALFLQPARDARRLYATIVHSKTNCDGYKPRGVTFPSAIRQQELMEQVYLECGVDPATVDYIEAHATGTQAGDPEEVIALQNVFLPGREEPLPIGSLKSNLGHTESASATCSITKVLLCMEMGKLLPNLHFNKPIPVLDVDRLKVVTEVMPWDGKLAAVNAFGFGGANCHILLRRNPKKKVNGGRPADRLPRLLAVSGRSADAVKSILDDALLHPADAEFANLLHCVHVRSTPGHLYRGHVVLGVQDSSPRISLYSEKRPPLWFVLSGLGSQWPGMGAPLMPIPAFAAAIKKCDRALKPLGVDIHRILTDTDPSIFDSAISCFVGVAAVQIGLLDTLAAIGVVPDGILSHSIGDLLRAYADGSLSLEQTILAAYYQGLACQKASLPRSALVIAGKDSKDVLQAYSGKLQVVSTGGADSYIASGAARDVDEFAKRLQACGKQVKVLQCGGVPCHSKNLAPAKPLLLQYLTKVLQQPNNKLSFAEHQVDKLLNAASFPDLARSIPIPSYGLSLEISPAALLPNVLFSLYGPGGVAPLLSVLGSLYNHGIDMDLTKLYPPVEYPVGRGTPMISPLVKWNHTKKWLVPADPKFVRVMRAERDITIKCNMPGLDFYRGHVIDGRNLFPATGYLALVWESMGHLKDIKEDYFSVRFQNVRFNRATLIPKEEKIIFTTLLSKSTSHFEVLEGSVAVVTGDIKEGCSPPMWDFKSSARSTSGRDKDLIDFSKKDIYKELKLRGYHYTGLFRSLLRVNQEHTCGYVQWQDNWCAFMDNILQVGILAHDSRGLYVPTFIEEISINIPEHKRCLSEHEDGVLPILMNKDRGIYKCGGMQLRGLKASPIARRKPLADPVLERSEFVPYCRVEYSLQQAVTTCVHLLLENAPALNLSVAELPHKERSLLSPMVVNIVKNLPLMQVSVTVFGNEADARFSNLESEIKVKAGSFSNAQKNHVVVVDDAVGDAELLGSALASLSDGGCVIARERSDVQYSEDDLGAVVVVDHLTDGGRILMLQKKKAPLSPGACAVVHITEDNYDWVARLQAAVKDAPPQKRVFLVAQNEPLNGILGLFNCLLKELANKTVRCVFIRDDKAPPFDPVLPFYRRQLDKDLAVNILEDGQWGSYRHFLLDELSAKDCTHAYSSVKSFGDLASMAWYQGWENTVDGKDVIHIYYSALNFKDVMLATGRLAVDVICPKRTMQQYMLGFEFSGRTSSGERVMGMTDRSAIANIARVDPTLTWRVPDQWTLEQAATVPCVYATVLHAYIDHGKVQRGESILIHAGSGGIGQAAITVALRYGMTVFTTVGTPEKRAFIRKHFPEIPAQNIGNSRDSCFEQMIMRETQGRGVDLVLNSLAEEKLEASVRCLAKGGRFLEIGKFDLANNKQLAMELFSDGKSYHGVMADIIFAGGTEKKMALFKLMKDALDSGVIQPLRHTTVFSEDDVEQAYRYMAAGKHVGKVLIKIRDEEPNKAAVPSLKIMKARPRFYCDDKLSYIIAGGLGGFGLELADWLVCRGARNLVLTSRRGITSGYQSSRVRIWRSYGAKIFISTQDFSTYSGAKQLITEATQLAPVGGIFNLAVVLRDALFENQDASKFAESARGKAVATKHLDEVSRLMCAQLRHFVVFSSVSCGRGNVGQTNYGMANSTMERICEARVRDGFPGLAVQWGAIGEVGLVADMQDENQELVIGGTLQQTIASCMEVMDTFLLQPHPVVASMVVAEKQRGGDATSVTERVLGILGLTDQSKIRPNALLSDLGMDSMTGVEIKQVLEQEYEIFLTAQKIRELTVQQLEELAGQEDINTEAQLESHLDSVLPLSMYLKKTLSKQQAEYPAVVELPSLRKSPSTVFMIPGSEGLADSLSPLAAQLDNKVISFQMFTQECGYGVSDVADFFLPMLSSAIQPGAPIPLIGFSYGGLAALKLVAALERQGHQCKLVLLDSTPDLLGMPIRLMLEKDKDSLQAEVISKIMEAMEAVSDDNKKGMFECLTKMSSWEEKLDWLVDKLTSQWPTSPTHIHKFLDGAYQRLLAIVEFDWEPQLRIKSPVIFIRPTTLLYRMPEEDCGLSKYCDNVQAVHVIESTHFTIPAHRDTAKYINEFLASP